MSKPTVILSIQGKKARTEVQTPKLELYLSQAEKEGDVILRGRDSKGIVHSIVSIQPDGEMYRWSISDTDNTGLQLTACGEIRLESEDENEDC